MKTTIVKKLFLRLAILSLWYGTLWSIPYELKKVLDQYSREITILEIGKKECPYLLSFMNYNAQCIGMCIGGVPKALLSKVSQGKKQNGILLGPKRVEYDMLHTLGSCEHFDIVIVHDLKIDDDDFTPLVTVCLRLGDHIVIEAISADRGRICTSFGMRRCTASSGTSFFYAHKKKMKLERARFTQKLEPTAVRPLYRITSDFTSKFFSKGPLFVLQRWIHGINLVTFAMLRGVYPTDSIIRGQLAAFRKTHANHNDLVIGNIIMRGTKLIPIDFNDTRRSAGSTACIAAALQAFEATNRRLRNPQKWINDYYNSL